MRQYCLLNSGLDQLLSVSGSVTLGFFLNVVSTFLFLSSHTWVLIYCPITGYLSCTRLKCSWIDHLFTCQGQPQLSCKVWICSWFHFNPLMHLWIPLTHQHNTKFILPSSDVSHILHCATMRCELCLIGSLYCFNSYSVSAISFQEIRDTVLHCCLFSFNSCKLLIAFGVFFVLLFFIYLWFWIQTSSRLVYSQV